MADIRIKDLTTTASSTASDDFIAIDGTTNGTRKLNAYSPTFGGNATVTGTLTANSAITGPTLAPGVNTAAHYFTAYGATTSWPLRLSTIYDSNYVDQYLTLNGTLTGSRATPTFTGAAVGGSFIRSNGENSVLSIGTFVSGSGAAINTVAVFNPTNLTIPQTTASTTTSTGALVVSGGVGVAGAVNTGGGFSTVGAMTLPAAWTAAYGLGLSSDSNVSKVWYGDGTGKELQFISRTGSTNTVRMTLTDTGALTVTGNVGITATTASTSTSTGALTCSGGVGVAGAINAGSYITAKDNSGGAIIKGTQSGASFASNTAAIEAFTDNATTGANNQAFGALRSGDTNYRALISFDGYLYLGSGSGTADTNLYRSAANTLKTDDAFIVGATTASTSTSSGALVVSGGVGVAKNINAGDIIEVNFSGPIAFRGTSTNSDCQLRLVNNSSGGREYHLSSSGTAAGGGAGFHVWDGTDNVSALSIDASRNSTFGGSVKTSAPSGGTAAAWKLGTVATVSPTSPNRTIEVDIGGTIYYIHAKTTNN